MFGIDDALLLGAVGGGLMGGLYGPSDNTLANILGGAALGGATGGLLNGVMGAGGAAAGAIPEGAMSTELGATVAGSAGDTMASLGMAGLPQMSFNTPAAAATAGASSSGLLTPTATPGILGASAGGIDPYNMAKQGIGLLQKGNAYMNSKPQQPQTTKVSGPPQKKGRPGQVPLSPLASTPQMMELVKKTARFNPTLAAKLQAMGVM